MTKKPSDPDFAREKSIASFPVSEDDPNVVMPADVRASIPRAQAAVAPVSPAVATKGQFPFRTAVTDQDVQDARDRYLDTLEAAGKTKRQQPLMITGCGWSTYLFSAR
jgi:hypothetical protein